MFGIGKNKTFRVEVHMNSGKVHKITIPRNGRVNPTTLRTYAKKCIADDGRLDITVGNRSLHLSGKHIECVEIFE